MAFTEDQLSWLETAQAKSAEFVAFGETMRQRNAAMEKFGADIDRLQDELRKASLALKVTWDDEEKAGWFKKSKRQMDWMNGDRDSEIDTVHDLQDGYDVDPEAAKRVQVLHMELVRIQTQMEQATDEDGNELFSAKDIERELWSPLILSGAIPSNAVGDKYSQEAQAWNGACQIYEDRLKEHSKTASKNENAKIWLKRAMDFTSFAGTIAGESIKAANFDGMSLSKAERDQKVKLGKIPPEQLSEEQKTQLKSLTERDNHAKIANRDLAILQVTTTVVQGGLNIADGLLDKPSEKRDWGIAEKAFGVLESAALSSLDLAGKQVAVGNPDLAKEAGFKTAMASATSLVSYGFKAGKVVFRFKEILDAKDEGGRKAAASGMIKAIAGAVGDAFAAFDTQSGKSGDGTSDITGTGGQWAKIGGAINIAIVGSADIGFIVDHVVKSQGAGGLKNPSALVAAVGLNVVAPIMVGVFDKISDASRRDVGSGSNPSEGWSRAFEETGTEAPLNRQTGKTMGGVAETMSKTFDILKGSTQSKENETELARATDAKKLEEQVMGALRGLDLSSVDPKMLEHIPAGTELEDQKRIVAERLAKQEAEDRKQAMTEFKTKLRDDPKFKEEFFAEIKAQSDKEAAALEKLIGEARSNDPEDLADEEKARKAMAAVDKLIAEATACNTKWQLIDTMTSGGAAILVAALPVAGLAAALQRLAMDVAILIRKSAQLNDWMKNMALTEGNNSVYGPAIQSRLASAAVQVSQQATRVIFDAIGVAAETAKLADCTGAATGISIGNSMAKALTEYGFKLHKEVEIERGWQLYKDARASKGDRKKARKAMRWNSTLSKCVLAYGIVMDGDPIAKEVGRSCGLTPEVLADQKNVCTKVVTYFQTLYSDDPVVMRRIPLTKDWHPGSPALTLDSWMRFKAAAISRARPNLAEASARTPGIDGTLAQLAALIGSDGNYGKKRDALYPEVPVNEPSVEDTRATPAYRRYLEDTREQLGTLVSLLRSWRPLTGTPGDDVEKPWAPGMAHDGMADIAESLLAQAQLALGEVSYDLDLLDEREAEIERRKSVLDDLVLEELPLDDDEDEKDDDK